MKLNEFKIGEDFIMDGQWYRCTDIGTRVVIAVKHINTAIRYNSKTKEKTKYEENTIKDGLLSGPPYAVAEYYIDEYNQEICYKTQKEYDNVHDV